MAVAKTFRAAVESCPDLKDCFRDGLRGFKGEHRALVALANPRDLAGSVDLDTALSSKPKHRNAHRWDYGLGYRAKGGERVVWVEVHPATSSEVPLMIKKLDWLKGWLKSAAPSLANLPHRKPNAHVWLATKAGVKITSASRHARLLAAAGLALPTRTLKLP